LDPALDADAVARTMVALFHGLVLQRSWSTDDVDVEAYRTAVRALLGGLGRKRRSG
jgi:hypothetical protein